MLEAWAHVWFCEAVGVRFPFANRLLQGREVDSSKLSMINSHFEEIKDLLTLQVKHTW
jgi:hypothetical protein